MEAAIIAGAFSSPQSNFSLVPFSCPTGNCTWPTIPTLGICNQCENVTSQLISERMDEREYFSLPNQAGIFPDAALLNVSATSNASESVAFRDRPELLFAFTLLDRANNFRTKATAVDAVECAFFFCMKALDVRVENGLLTERTLDTWIQYSGPMPKIPPRIGDRIEDLKFTEPPSIFNISKNSPLFSIDVYSFVDLKLKLPRYFNGTVKGVNSTANLTASNIIYSLRYQNTTDWAMRVANSMTSYVRQNLDYRVRFENIGQSSYVGTDYEGLAWKTEPILHVKWGWITLSLALVLFANFYLYYTMHKTSSAGCMVWKSHQLPLIFHGLAVDDLDTAGDLVDINSMEDQAKRLYTKLERGPDGYQLASKV